ncbi:hypothetical protein ACSQ8B_14040 [Marinovum sp. F03]|uniref:hypothetical protein n=1 Tax=Marinovum sp. F03 TaxID=3449226 RepID=UPI003EDC4665
MTTFDPAAADIWADLSEGAAHNPEKGEIRAWAGTVETAVQALEGDVADLQAAGSGVIEHLDPVAVATTANITLSGEQTLDTDVTTSTSRVLVKDQTDASENGIYVSAAGAWARATDANTAAKISEKAVLVEGGATHGGQVWGTYFAADGTLDTDDMAWVKQRDDSGMQDQLDAKANTADLATVATSGSSDDLTEGSTNLLLTVAERASIAATSGLADLADTRGNLVVPDDPDYQAGYRISSSTGAMTAVSGYDTTGYIPVESGEAYVTNLSYAYIAYFDSDQNFVSSASATAVDLHAEFTAPGDGYVRGSIGSTGGFDPDQIYLVKSATVPDAVAPNGNLVVNDRISQLPAASIADGAVSPLKTEMWAIGKNKANPVGRVDGYYMSTAGAPIASGSYCYWPAFAVEEGQVWTANQNMRFVTFYDVGGRAWSTAGVSTSVTQFTVPADAASAVVTSTLSTASTFQVELAASSTAFEEFHYAGQDSLPSGEPLHWGVPDGADLTAALDTELGSTDWRDTSAVPAFYGLDRLRETRQRLRMLKYGQTGEDAQLSLGLIGDSFTHDNGRYALKVARFLWRKYLPDDTNVEYGPTGYGWVGFRGADTGSNANGTIYWNNYMAGSGTWTSTGSGEYSPDICAIESSTATDYIEMAASFTYSSDNPVFTLFAEGGGGVVRYRWTGAGGGRTLICPSCLPG